MSKCEMRWCIGDAGLTGTVRVNENLGDASYSTRICRVCAAALGLKDGDDLPEPELVRRGLRGDNG